MASQSCVDGAWKAGPSCGDMLASEITGVDVVAGLMGNAAGKFVGIIDHGPLRDTLLLMLCCSAGGCAINWSPRFEKLIGLCGEAGIGAAETAKAALSCCI